MNLLSLQLLKYFKPFNTIDFDKMPIDSAIKLLASCDGFLLTGGEDVVSSYYGKTADRARCENVIIH